MSPELRAIMLAVGGIAVGTLLHFLLVYGRRLVVRSRTALDDAIVEAIDRPMVLVVSLVGFDLAFALWPDLPENVLNAQEDIFFVLYAIIALYTVLRLIGGLVKWYGAEVTHRTATELDDQFLTLFRHLAVIIAVALSIVIVLNHFGIEISALVATLGVTSLAIALAAQETLHNMIAGFLIMLDQPFQEGDRIEILDLDTWGDVQEIGLRSTRILTVDNRAVAIPNAVIGNGLVVNHTKPNPAFRIQTSVGVAYGVDIEQVRHILEEAIRSEPWVLSGDKHPVEALFMEFGDSSLNFTIRCWIRDYVDTRPFIDKMNTAIYKALNREGIEIPFPQQVVYLQRDE